MIRLRISPTLLNEWRTVRLGLYNTGPERLIEAITGEFKANAAISRGWAYHKLLEEGPERYRTDKPDKKTGFPVPVYSVYEPQLQTTWEFSAAAVEPVYRLHEQYSDMAHEVWGHWETKRGPYHVRSNMKLDGLHGHTLNEFKTTGSPKKWADYYPSMQWRLNLLAFPELETVRYHVFKLNDANTTCDYETFTFQRYAELERDVLNELDGLLNWLGGFPELFQHLNFDDNGKAIIVQR